MNYLMPLYRGRNVTCDKCGCGDIVDHYREAGKSSGYPDYHRHEFGVIDRCCRNCQFKWRERALDEAEEQEAK